jgi:hypothetical protein
MSLWKGPGAREAGPGERSPSLVPAVLLVLLWGGAAGAAAQEPPTADPPIPGVERPTWLSPWSGPPGTLVTVRGELLPAITPVHVALGGTRAGFEALTLALTTRYGELEETVRVPEWARRDRAHRFIIFDAYFAPLATTALFHVTDPDGSILRVGRVTGLRAGCASFAGDDEERYAVEGELDGLSVGDRGEMEAVILESAPCGQGIPVRLREFRRVGTGGGP